VKANAEICYPFLGQPHPPILKHSISLTNREPERAKDENRNQYWSIITRGGDSRGKERELK